MVVREHSGANHRTSGDSSFGQDLPETAIGGGYTVGFFAGGAALGQNTNARGGHYLALRESAGAGPTAGNGPLAATQAFRVDTKMDDGQPDTGSVFSNSATNCTTAGPAYDEANNPVGCALYIRIQG